MKEGKLVCVWLRVCEREGGRRGEREREKERDRKSAIMNEQCMTIGKLPTLYLYTNVNICLLLLFMFYYFHSLFTCLMYCFNVF